MFNIDELQFLIICVDARPISGTKDGRNKAAMLNKIATMIDEMAKQQAEEKEDDGDS